MTDVLDCSPESTREVRTCTSGPQLGCGTPTTDSSTAPVAADDAARTRPWISSSSWAA